MTMPNPWKCNDDRIERCPMLTLSSRRESKQMLEKANVISGLYRRLPSSATTCLMMFWEETAEGVVGKVYVGGMVD